MRENDEVEPFDGTTGAGMLAIVVVAMGFAGIVDFAGAVYDRNNSEKRPAKLEQIVQREHKLNVNQQVNLDPLNKNSLICYTGMASEKMFNLRPLLGSESMISSAYYPIDTKEILYNGYRLEVLEVKPEYIRLRYKGKEK